MTYEPLQLTPDLHRYLLDHSTPPDEVTAAARRLMTPSRQKTDPSPMVRTSSPSRCSTTPPTSPRSKRAIGLFAYDAGAPLDLARVAYYQALDEFF